MSYYSLLMGAGFGIIVVAVIIIIAWYVLCSYAHMKALKALGYDKAWLAWIPYGVFYACADVVTGQDEKVKLFGSCYCIQIVVDHSGCIFTFTTECYNRKSDYTCS